MGDRRCLQDIILWRARLATPDMMGLLDNGMVERAWLGPSPSPPHSLHSPPDHHCFPV